VLLLEEYEPAEQIEHVVLALAENRPATHSVSTFPEQLYPAGQVVLQLALLGAEYSPSAQLVQSPIRDPVSGKVPAAHSVHAEADELTPVKISVVDAFEVSHAQSHRVLENASAFLNILSMFVADDV
jgi:hypothetical protein